MCDVEVGDDAGQVIRSGRALLSPVLHGELDHGFVKSLQISDLYFRGNPLVVVNSGEWWTFCLSPSGSRA